MCEVQHRLTTGAKMLPDDSVSLRQRCTGYIFRLGGSRQCLQMPLSTHQKMKLMENCLELKKACESSAENDNVFQIIKLLGERREIFQVGDFLIEEISIRSTLLDRIPCICVCFFGGGGICPSPGCRPPTPVSNACWEANPLSCDQ